MNTMIRDKRLAVFDVDETLITCKSMFDFMQFALRNTLGRDAGGVVYVQMMEQLFEARKTAPRETVNRLFYRFFAGWRIGELQELAQRWFRTRTAEQSTFFHPLPLASLQQHLAAGDEVLLLSGSASFIIAPIAAHLGVTQIKAIDLELEPDGQTLTGEIAGVQTIGQGKAVALAQFLNELPQTPTDILGYGDHESDLPFLKCCNQQTVVVNTNNTQLPGWTAALKDPQFMFAGKPATGV